MSDEQEAIDDLFQALTRVCDHFNWDLSKREDPDDAEEVWVAGWTDTHTQTLAPLDVSDIARRAFKLPKAFPRTWQ